MPQSRSPADIEAILESGNFSELVGLVEDDRLECKGTPYQLQREAEKMELAKDVSGLANARGGLILIGCRTEKKQTVFGDVVREVSTFGRQLINPQDYYNVIASWVYPPLQMSVRWLPSACDPSLGIVVIRVPDEASQNSPFLVTKTVDESGKLRGTLFGLFRRQRDMVGGLSVQELRDRLKDGIRFSELDRRLENIEQMLAQFPASATVRGPWLSVEMLQARISEARKAVGLDGKPSFVLAAAPVENVQFPDVFSRGSSVVRLLEDPPNLRRNGFDLNTGRRSEIVGGALRRCVRSDDRLLELWRDGLLLFVGSGDADYLAWAQADTSGGLLVNTWVLVETTYLFANLTLELMQYAKPQPQRIQLFLVLEDMNLGGKPWKLEPYARTPNRAHLTPPRSAREPAVMRIVECTFEFARPGALAYSLLSELYIWFGFDADLVPLADRTKTPPEIDPHLIAG